MVSRRERECFSLKEVNMANKSMILLVTVMVLGLIGPPALAELKAPPTGKEIAVRAKR